VVRAKSLHMFQAHISLKKFNTVSGCLFYYSREQLIFGSACVYVAKVKVTFVPEPAIKALKSNDVTLHFI
jgi:hypothetical protein